MPPNPSETLIPASRVLKSVKLQLIPLPVSLNVFRTKHWTWYIKHKRAWGLALSYALPAGEYTFRTPITDSSNHLWINSVIRDFSLRMTTEPLSSKRTKSGSERKGKRERK